MLSAAEIDIINISAGGVSLLADVRLEMNREYTLRVENRDRAVSVRGVVVWSILAGNALGRQGETVPLYEAGLKFSDVMPEKSAEIAEFIERHKLLPDSRIIARFDVETPGKAVLHYHFSFRVNKLSMGGMLMQTDRPFRVNDTFPIEIFLPGERNVKVFGRIASCYGAGETEEGVRYNVGVEFLQIAEEDRPVLSRYIESL